VDLRKTILTLLAVALFATATNARAEEQHSIMTALTETTLSGYVDTSASWWSGGLPGRTNVPENDNVVAAQIVNAAQAFVPTNLTGATLEFGEPFQPGQTGSVWYRWDVTQSGVARIATTNITPVTPTSATSTSPALSDESIFYPGGGIVISGGSDGVITVGVGDVQINFGYLRWWTDLVVYRAIQLSDGQGGFEFIQRGGSLQFAASSGDAFLIGIEVYENSPAYQGQPEISPSLPSVLNFDLTPPPPNDSFDSSFVIADSSHGYLAGYTLAATREPGEPDLGEGFSGGSVWFHFKAATYGAVTIGYCEANAVPCFGNTAPIAVFTGSELANLSPIAKVNGGPLSFFVEEGKTYHIAVYQNDPTTVGFNLNLKGPIYRLFETNADALFPAGSTPHFYGVRGVTMLAYKKTATGWDLFEIEPIVNQAADLLIHPSDALDGQLRVLTIDDPMPAPHVTLRHSRGLLVADLAGIPGQTCAVSYSTDLANWSEPEVFTLTSATWPWRSFDSTHPNYFFRVTQSLPQPTAPSNFGARVQILPPPPPSDLSLGGVSQSIAFHHYGGYGGYGLPLSPVPAP
jgi:hypothetical protein